MLTPDQIRKKYPGLAGKTDEELSEVQKALYTWANLAFESWAKESGSTASPLVICQKGR